MDLYYVIRIHNSRNKSLPKLRLIKKKISSFTTLPSFLSTVACC